MNKSLAILLAAGVLTLAATTGARADLVTNGSFEDTTHGPGQLGYNTGVTGWTTSGYNFVFAPSTADGPGATGQYGNLQLWGPGNGSTNGMPASSPDGGNFIAADGAYMVAPITQSITGLTAGVYYTVSFYWAAAQQYTYTGDTTEQWKVSLGGQTQATAVYDNSSHGFSGWFHESMTFLATDTNEALSFLAIGTPSGEPPFSLLDGVSMQPVPEPASATLLLAGLVGLARVVRRRRR